ncbi:MAG: CRISPR system precrRNA processing endoribonuclease RAMP protein Cas6 [Methylococcaceae bacterium]|nr:CRISPR system precrRNA processing endoribonuclease RAMP protein Cas6 [Methylococcaceae bacterium]
MDLNLPISVFRFEFQAEDGLSLPVYAGSAWRGALGHALKRTVCVARDTPCAKCMLSPDTAKMRHYNAAPHPFVLLIEPQQSAPAYRLGLNLFGRAYQYLPYLIHALEKAGRRGIGKQILSLASVAQAENCGFRLLRTIYQPGQSPLAATQPPMPPLPASLGIEIETPLRLRNQGHYVTPETFRFTDLFGSLLRRISLPNYFHTNIAMETDFAGLTQKARSVQIHEPCLRWWDWTRYSSRQDTEMQMGGILGNSQLDGAQLAQFWLYLWLGQWTHAGKATAMGLGRYRSAM